MEGENRLVYEFIPMSRIGSNRRGVDGVQGEIFTGCTSLALRLSRNCFFRCRREFLAALEAGIVAVSRALASSVFFSCCIPATRSRDLVVCMLHIFLLCVVTSRCGA